MRIISFYEFISGFKNDDTLLGHVYQLVRTDKHFPKDACNRNFIFNYLKYEFPNRDVPLADIKRAISIYGQYLEVGRE